MAFQIDTFQADAFHLGISYFPYTTPLARRYTGSRLFTTVTSLLTMRATAAGELDTVDIWLPNNNTSATSIIFNLHKNSSPLWAGASRLIIPTGQSHIQKTDIGEAVVIGDLIVLAVEQCPDEGISTPIDFLGRIIVG